MKMREMEGLQGDTISAAATSAGEAGIGIVRISGEKAIEVAERVFCPSRDRSLRETGSYRAVYGKIGCILAYTGVGQELFDGVPGTEDQA